MTEPHGSSAVETAQIFFARTSRLLDADPRQAENEAAARLRHTPGEAAAGLILAAARRRQGDPAGALMVLSPLADLHPREPGIQNELGQCLAALGRAAEATAALRRAVSLKPDLSAAWRTLGEQLFRVGEAAAADVAFGRYIALPVKEQALVEADAAMRQGRLELAERGLRSHLGRHPADVLALWMLGDIGDRMTFFDEAAILLERCLTLAPGFRTARLTLVRVLQRQRREREALAQIERLMALDPTNPAYRKLTATLLDAVGEHARAITLFESILAGEPGAASMWVGYGNALKAAGRGDEAVGAFRRAMEIAPASGGGYWSLANLKTVRFTPEEEAAMAAQLGRTDLPPREALLIHNALGKALEDRGEHATSFEHYARSARLRRAEFHYDAAAATDLARRSMALFTPAFFADRAAEPVATTTPIFIVGLPRAGSTLVEQILASHSMVEATAELAEIMHLAGRLQRKGGRLAPEAYPACLADLPADARRTLGEAYLAGTQAHRRLGRPFFIDKTPHNFLHIGLIRLILPQARIIDVRRHPMAAGFSVFKQHFPGGHLFSCDLTEIGLYYRDYVGLMDHYDRAAPGMVHRIIYEDLVSDTESEIRRLLDYCDLPFEQACLDFHDNRRVVRTPSAYQVRRPIFREALDQWRNYEPLLGPLKAALGPALLTWRKPQPGRS